MCSSDLDLQHIVSNLVQMAFFLTPVLWDIKSVPAIGLLTSDESRALVLAVNPVSNLIVAWRQIFVSHEIPEWQPLLRVAALSLVLLWISSTVFERRREEFAELV